MIHFRRRESVRSLAAAGLVVVAVLSALVALVSDTLAARQRFQRAATEAAPPAAWQLGARQEQRFQRFLETAAVDVPAGARVAILGPGTGENPGAQTFFLSLWAAWHRPQWLVLRRFSAADAATAEYWVTYRRRLEPEVARRRGLQGIATHPLGAVYRREEPGVADGDLGSERDGA